MYFVLSVNITR